MRGRTIRIAIGAVCSAILLYLAARDVHWSEVLASLRDANYWLVPLIMAATYWTLYIRAQRWRVLLEPLGTPDMRTLVAATNIGFMANMVLPLRVGEVIRPALVTKREKLALGGVLATIVLERIFDMITVLLLFGISMTMVTISERAKNWGLTLTGLALIVGALMIALRWQENLALRMIRSVCSLLPETVGGAIESFVEGFIKALEILHSLRDFLRVFAWSLGVWAVIALVNVFGLATFHLPLASTLAVTAIVAIAVSVPSAPGFIGSFQIGCVVALGMFGIEESEAMAFSLVHHVAQFLTLVAAGLYSLWKENLRLSEIEPIEEVSVEKQRSHA